MAPRDWSAPGAAAEASEKAPRGERAFFARFFETQLFHGHLGARLDEDEARQRQAEQQLTRKVRSADCLVCCLFVCSSSWPSRLRERRRRASRL